jgi:hypothetical protein
MDIGIENPSFISGLFKPEVQDTNKAEILHATLSNKFVTNSKTGELLVITGQVKNGYPEARSAIRVRGKLFSKGGVLAGTAMVYCGNILSDPELSSLDMDTINKRLQNKAGDKKSNIGVQPGQTIPFMIVFSNLPKDLEEYQLESAGSVSSR